MKFHLNFIFGAILCTCMISCQKDDSDTNDQDNFLPGINAPIVGTLIDGGQISDISLYCVENDKDMTGMLWYEYYAKTKTVNDYTDFYLHLELNRNADRYIPVDDKERNGISQIEFENEKTKSAFIAEDYRNYIENTPLEEQKIGGWPSLFTAYVNGEVAIICDKQLFGEEPGTNLNKHFKVDSGSRCLPIGIEDAKLLYKFGDEIPSDMDKYFLKETWLQPNYKLRFKDNPSERYDEITLHVSVPMVIEYCHDYAVAQYKGQALKSKYSETELDAQCLIKFKWD